MGDGAATAEAIKQQVYDAGAAFMLDPATADYGAEHGYGDWNHFYFAGRCGVLGEVDSAVVTAGLGFLAPRAVEVIWPVVRDLGPVREAAEHYVVACETFGRTRLAELSEAETGRLAELAERVVDAADVSGLSLFAGWKAVERPADPRGRAMFAIHLLREWRGGVHLACVTAAGVAPLEAIVLSGNQRHARLFGWPEPWGDGGGKQRQFDAAEAATRDRCAEVIGAALSDDEQAELVAIVQRAADAISAGQPS